VPVTTIRVVSGADMLEAEGLMLKGMFVGYVGTGCKVKGHIITINTVRVKGGEAVYSIRPGPHKAGEAKGFRNKMGKTIKGVGRNDVRELRYKGRGRWDHIPGVGCSVTSI
jgi:hypothetical protein